MNTRNDGGPAFPQPREFGHFTFQGLTLRDYFATEAMVGIYSCASVRSEEEVARKAYAQADAMLKERAK